LQINRCFQIPTEKIFKEERKTAFKKDIVGFPFQFPQDQSRGGEHSSISNARNSLLKVVCKADRPAALI
jgi:hypothetical protein